MKQASPLISVIVPLHNEATGLARFHSSLRKLLDQQSAYDFEIIYCNDGSTDASLEILQSLSKQDQAVRVVSLVRNFGKEMAITAGLRQARGLAAITLDGDGQHPIEILPEFIAKWQSGSKVVVGLRPQSGYSKMLRRTGSLLFHKIIGIMAHVALMPNATDYRMIDRVVIDEFNQLTEHNRISRGLIDWLGYKQAHIVFMAKPRKHDDSAYSSGKLFKLAIDSIISLSSSPLYLVAIVGVIILPLSVLLGVVLLANFLLGDPFGWNVTGSGYLSVVLLFMSSLILMTQGIFGLYLTHIHSEAQNRPLYIVDKSASHGLDS